MATSQATKVGSAKISRASSSAARWSLYLLFFLLPVFFLPWTSDVLELNKQTLLILLTSVALIGWLGNLLVSKKFEARSGLLNVLPLLFLLAVFFSSFFSIGNFQSWVGQASQEYMSFLSVVAFILLFYALVNVAHETRVQGNLIFALLLSTAISSLVTLLGMFNVFHLPFSFAQSAGFNTIGTLNSFALFLSAVMFMGMAMWLVSEPGRDSLFPEGARRVFMRFLVVLVSLVAMVAMIAIDFWVIWVVNLLGVAALAIFAFLQSKAFGSPGKFVLPISVFVVSILLLFFQSPLRLSLPVVVSPSYSLSWEITRDVLSQEGKRTFFGSGPGTFSYDYSLFKPEGVNSTAFWNITFDRSKSYFLTLFATMGIVGVVAWSLLVLGLFGASLHYLIRSRGQEEWKMTYTMFVGWIVIACAHILYSSNFSLQFLFWGFSGLLASQLLTKVRHADFKASPRLGLLTSFGFVTIGIAVISGIFIAGSRYSADVAFANAVKLDRSGAPVEEVIQSLVRAASGTVGSKSDIYFRNLSSAVLMRAREVIQEAGAENLTQEQVVQIQGLVKNSIEFSRVATALEPANVSNWVVQGAIYRDVLSFVENAEDFAAVTYEQAIQLEPLNPSHHTNLGRVHLLVADRAAMLLASENAELAAKAQEALTSQLSEAEAAFSRAIELKRDYAPAHFYLAATYERQGRLEDAASRLAAIRNVNQTDVGLAFQLSLLLLRLEEYDLARKELERIVALSPDFSNALWYLASAYEIVGDQQKAIEAVEHVAELNPGNEAVMMRLNRMRAGELTTQIPRPIEEGEEGVVEAPEGEVVEGDETPPAEEPAPEAPAAE